MKNIFKLAAVCLLVLSNNVFANYYEHFHDLKVELRNFGSDNCDLTKAYLYSGSLYNSDFPSILAATGERYYFTLTGDKTDAVVTYKCGSHKQFTLRIGQVHKRKHKHTSIDARMTDAIDVFETHQKMETMYVGHKYPGELNWQFFH